MKQYSLFGIKPDVYLHNFIRGENDKLKKQLPENPYDFIDYVKFKFKVNNFEIIEEKEYIMDYATAEKHYEEHKLNPNFNFKDRTFEGLIDFMTSGKSYCFIFYGDDSVKKGREILIEIRDEYLVDRKFARYNMTHASDSIESANKEIMLHFPQSKALNK